ncbi:MAG: AAA family ATPase [Bacteroidaceae bacterium]|nr:AAA family ATPase [Bacteroidaceae bacterium]
MNRIESNDMELTRQKWVNEGGIYFPISGDTMLLKTPGKGVFNVVKSQNPMDARLGLQRIGDTFEFNFKIYELGCEEMLQTIRKTWESEVFVRGEKNLGVIFNGLKGTGKTLSAKLLCNALDLPVVIVQYPYEGLVNFLQSLCFECIVFIDEAEKTFKKGEDDDVLLRLIDGVYNQMRKLYILTTNQLTLNDNLLGRPGRIRYRFEFGNLLPKAVKDYLDDNLLPKYANQRKSILEQVDLLEISTIDILKALVDEVNIHGRLPESQCLNIPTAKHAFEILEFYYIAELDRYKEIKAFIDKHMKEDDATTVSEWLHKPQKTNKKKTNEDMLEDKFDSVYIATLTSPSPTLIRDVSTSRGIIETEPNTDGYFLMRDRYEDSAHLCLLLRKKNNPSLYRGMLVS